MLPTLFPQQTLELVFDGFLLDFLLFLLDLCLGGVRDETGQLELERQVFERAADPHRYREPLS